MKIRDLIEVCNDFEVYMYNENTKTSKNIPLEKDNIYHEEIMNLKVKEIYSDCGVVVEAKFNKQIWKVLKM